MTDLTDAQICILYGLTLSGGSIVAASEMAEVRPLERTGYIATWRADGGFLAWGITKAGRDALALQETRADGIQHRERKAP